MAFLPYSHKHIILRRLWFSNCGSVMPELPEVETTKRGIEPYVKGSKITKAVIRHFQLRWPVDKSLARKICHQYVLQVTRRGKYLLLRCDHGSLIIHLGMSGRLRILLAANKAQKHDHLDIEFANGYTLRYTDARRFGAVVWTDQDPLQHDLLINMGPEPLTTAFNVKYLLDKSKNKKLAIKNFIMDSHVVAGVGNIYAAEALFLAQLHPEQPAGQLTLAQAERLVAAIKNVLKKAIKKGGTTLRDYAQSDGNPGYFQQVLNVYGREKLPCRLCNSVLQLIRIGQRSTVFCPRCQAP